MLVDRGMPGLFPAQRAPRTGHQCQPGNFPARGWFILARARALRPITCATTAFAGTPKTSSSLIHLINHRSVASVVLCTTGEVCRTGRAPAGIKRMPSSPRGRSRLVGTKISECTTGEV